MSRVQHPKQMTARKPPERYDPGQYEKQKGMHQQANFADPCNSVEPRFFKEAGDGPQGAQWKNATDADYNSLLKNETWELVDLPENKM